MTRIERKTQKIFAGNAATDELAVFGSMNTGNPIYTDNIETLQSTNYEEGWSSAIAANEAPWLEELNGVQYGLSKQIAYQFQEGIAEYDAGTAYFAGSWCKSLTNNIDGQRDIYQSLTDNNLNNPLTDTVNWKKVEFGGANKDLSNLSETGQAVLDAKANTDLTNLTPAGEKHFVNKSQITNCILEAPEKIKIVYEGSDIVIKAGTIAIVPSGFEADGITPKFEEYTLDHDITVANDMTQAYFMGLNFSESGTNTWRRYSSGCYTGPTAPTSPVTYDIWYDTSTNIIRRHDGTQWYVQKHSLPIASIDGPKYSITSVFNTIGGFGTSFFVQKGVKFLMPNGKNPDGTLNNIEYTTDKVLLQINTAVSSYNLEYALLIDNQGGVSHAFTSRCYISPIKPIINPKSGNEYWYNPTTNIITDFNFNVPSPRIACIIPFVASIKNSKIFSIQPVEPVSVLGRENKHEILNWNAPSPVYEDLTLGASGSKYYMPANGYLQAACTGTMGSTFFELTSPEISATASYNGGWGRCSIPVRAEQEITVFYGGTNFTSRLFRFTYAEGER